MPELPEVEVLMRHLRPRLRGKTIRTIEVRRARVLAPTSAARFRRVLLGATFQELRRRGKYLLFQLRPRDSGPPIHLLGHLGMAGRMFVAAAQIPLPKHAAVIFQLGTHRFIYQDTRYFGRLTLNVSAIEKLGPEPWDKTFTPAAFQKSLKSSRQAVKVKLLDQSLVAGVGNIYASEALFRAGLSPRRAARSLTRAEAARLLAAIRAVLREAIAGGSTMPLDFTARNPHGLFYFGHDRSVPGYYEEHLRVYDRAGKPCGHCGKSIKRIVQAARSTYFCPACQR